MRLLDKNYAVTSKLSNPAGIVPKCPKVGTKVSGHFGHAEVS